MHTLRPDTSRLLHRSAPVPPGGPPTGTPNAGDPDAGGSDAGGPNDGDLNPAGPGGPRSSPSGSNPASGPHSPSGPDAPLTDAQWRRLRAPFSRKAYEAWPEHGAERGSKAVVRLWLHPQTVEERLDLVVGPGGYSFTYRVVEGAHQPSVLGRLTLGGATRSGVGTGSRLLYAAEEALVVAARGFGIGREGPLLGGVLTDMEHRFHVPDEKNKQLETAEEPTLWTPEGWTPERE